MVIDKIGIRVVKILVVDSSKIRDKSSNLEYEDKISESDKDRDNSG